MADISCSKLEEDEVREPRTPIIASLLTHVYFLTVWLQEATKWCNQMLSCGGHDALVTDLGSDLADGVLLIKIMEVACE